MYDLTMQKNLSLFIYSRYLIANVIIKPGFSIEVEFAENSDTRKKVCAQHRSSDYPKDNQTEAIYVHVSRNTSTNGCVNKRQPFYNRTR